MPSRLPLVSKARKPKFELHLTIYDLNNVPLVSGTSSVKWQLPHSMHGEHRGRTNKCPIDSINHRVSYNCSKVMPLRISIDRNNNLTECPIEFEVTQEFPITHGGRDEKITLGTIKLNLSEYVEESEAFPRKSTGGRVGASLEHAREKILGSALHGPGPRRMGSVKNSRQASSGPISPASTGLTETGIAEEEVAEEGIVRRYLMQESKINSTLKLGILMLQVDGERNYVAPPLKTAPMFGGIAGIMAGGEAVEPVDEVVMRPGTGPNLASANKSRDASELQDMYRRSLAASWSCQPGELAADECIEDIFSGGDGWKDLHKSHHRSHQHHRGRDASTGSSNTSGSDDAAGGTLRPSDMRKISQHLQHARNRSGGSKESLLTVTGRQNGSSTEHSDPFSSNGTSSSRYPSHQNYHKPPSHHDRKQSTLSLFEGRSRSESLASLAPTLGSLDSDRARGSSGAREGGYGGFRGPGGNREVDESEVRDDLVSWALPGTAVS
ncbi:N-terminal C2 in EEIG1 and EHBP1 proteins-domain-containing protein [Xylariales sp. AK1849]|nr:N-terminal C2 in EEIG1 and EHBP1 proteins-domain-containing protein [Xylariales sp. AK1849]